MHKVSFLAHNWLALKINNKTVSDHGGNWFRGTVYDLGCGVRPYEPDILKHAKHYIGVDWSNTLHGLQADIVADLNQHLPIESNVADTVVSFQVMEHLSEPQIMLREAHRILKSGGNIFLTVPFQWWIHEAPYDFFRYTPYGLKYLLEKAGFADVVVEPQAGFFTMWFLKFNYFTLRLIRGPRPLRWVFKAVLLPIWYLDQKAAPCLDKLDKNWAAETSGYFVTARRP